MDATATTVGDPAEENFGWSLGVLLRAYHGAMATVLDGFPHEQRGYQVLAAVVHGAQPSQLALAAHLGIDRTVMTYVIDDLVDAGLVERRPDPADRRRRRIVATDRGEHALAQIEQHVTLAEDRLLAALAPDDRDTFRGLLRRIACGVRDVAPQIDACEVVAQVLADGARDEAGAGPS